MPRHEGAVLVRGRFARKDVVMRHTMIALLAMGLLLGVTSVDAQAQDPADRFHVSVGAGFTAPNSEVLDQVGYGYALFLGVQFDITPVVAIEGYGSTNILGERDQLLLVSPTPFAASIPRSFSINMGMELAAGNVVVQSPTGKYRPYGLVGVGVYNRPITVSTTSLGWVQGFCDPFWYSCFSGFTPVENVVGDRSSTDFGMDVGGGVNFGKSFFIEARFHHIWGPTIELIAIDPDPLVPTPAAQKADGHFLVTSFGVRF
jgi:hypothetical protein